ncbi:MAG: HEAT repeat domain-containing protein [Anaerolineae bacterium]|nr:HEAT repeat domain-containing protein [Anaerolineae bacterium]
MEQNNQQEKLSLLAKKCIDNLGNPNPRQRSQAAQELGKLGVTAAVPALIETLKYDVNTYVRTACAEALGHIGDIKAIFPLIDAMHDSCSFVRRSAAIALGQLQAKESQGVLLQALEDPNFYVRRAAINAIGKLGISDMGALLLPLLDTSDPRIQRTVITAMRRLQTQEGVPQMVHMLEAYMEYPSPRDLPIVKSLVITLGDLGAEEAVPVLMKIVQGYVGARSLAAKALGEIGDPRAGTALLAVLADKSTNLQLATLKSLGHLHYQQAAPEVRRFFKSPDPRLRRIAALTAGQLQDEIAKPLLLQMAYEDPSSLVRPAAIEALGEMDDPALLPELLPLVDDANAYLRAALSDTLSRLNDGRPEIQHALAQLSEDKIEHVSTAAKRAIDRLEPEKPQSPSPPPPKKEFPAWFRKLLGRI